MPLRCVALAGGPGCCHEGSVRRLRRCLRQWRALADVHSPVHRRAGATGGLRGHQPGGAEGPGAGPERGRRGGGCAPPGWVLLETVARRGAKSPGGILWTTLRRLPPSRPAILCPRSRSATRHSARPRPLAWQWSPARPTASGCRSPSQHGAGASAPGSHAPASRPRSSGPRATSPERSRGRAPLAIPLAGGALRCPGRTPRSPLRDMLVNG